jgi:predicted restriction endonuclease
LDDYLEILNKYRHGSIDASQFPDCAPAANDKRMIREFLLFLVHYDYCSIEVGISNQTTKFIRQDNLATRQYLPLSTQISQNKFHATQLPEPQNPFIENSRRKKFREVAIRDRQSKFRTDVLERFHYSCLFTGERIPLVLEACHIVSVQHKGSDSFSNGLCLRADVHTLFDNRHIRIRPDGVVEYSDILQQSVSYKNLPNTINIPSFVSDEALRWRYNYY